MSMNNSGKQQLLNNMIKELSVGVPSDERIDTFINQLKEIYEDGFRHSYSSITGVLLQINEKEEVIGLVVDNLSMIKEKMEEEETFPYIEKLYDHISLECIRIDQLYNSYNEKVENAKQTIEKSEKTIQEVKAEQEELKKILRKANEETENIRGEAGRLKTEVITILSIFAAIVLAFMGGMSFTASTFHGIATTSVYRVIAAVTICGLVIFNTIVALIYTVAKIIEKPIAITCKTDDCSCKKRCWNITIIRKRYPLIFWFNVMMLLLLLVDVAAWAIDAERVSDELQKLIWKEKAEVIEPINEERL